jgi:hypothetical protein
MWDGKSGRITVKSLGFDQVRYDLDLDGKGSTFAIGRSGSTSTIDGAKKPLPLWVAQYVGPEHIPTLSRVNDYTQSDRSVIYVGLEKFRDTEVHHIKLFRFEPDPQLTKIVEIMSEFHVFVEAKTGLVLKIQTNIFSPETPTNSSVVENVYSDFRMISNVPVPFHMVRKVDGQEQSDIAFDTVSFDTINTAADFQ